MAQNQNYPPLLEDPQADAAHRLSDGRDGLADEFADTGYADRQSVANAFADPNSQDDRRLGRSFEDSNATRAKHHRPVKEVVEAPFKKPGAGKVLFWVVAVLAVVFLSILLLGWLPRHQRDQETARRAQQEQQDPEIDVVKVSRAKDSAGLVIPGTTTPLIESSVYARANGYLKRRFVDIGDHVHKGQLLAIIDAPDLDQQVDQAREQLRQAQSQVDQQKTQLALTRITVERYRVLVAKGVFSRQDGDQREADYQAQLANVASAERNVEAFRANLNRTLALQSYERVTAPFDGIVTQRNVDAGDLISTSGSSGGNAPLSAGTSSSGNTQNGATNTSGASGSGSNLATPSTGNGGNGGALFTIAQANRLRILVSVPEGYAGLVHSGQHATLHFQEFPDNVFTGDVTRTSGSIDQNSRTLLTEIQIENHNGKLMPGMYAVATFAPAGGQGPLVISGDAIAIRKDQNMVAVVDQGKVRLQPVTVGRDYGPEVEILGGLHEGEMIASTFTDEVRDGSKVRVHENRQEEQKLSPPPAPPKPTPPGGSTQYGDPGITDQDMQGQSAKPQQKQSNGAQKKAAGKNGTTQ